jgi:hypothetical protein
MTTITPLIRLLPYQETHSFMFQYQDKSYRLNSGTRDTIHVFTRSICIYVLTVNRGLGYIGLDAYYPSEEDPVMTVFLHSDYQIKDALGSRWKHLLPSTIATKLIDYLI